MLKNRANGGNAHFRCFITFNKQFDSNFIGVNRLLSNLASA